MRIAMLTNNYKPIVGGVPVSIDRLSTALRKRGHEVTIFAPHFDGEKPEEGVVRFRIRKLPAGHGMGIPYLFDDTIEHHFNQINYDLIHVHHPMLIGKIGLKMAKKYDIPIVFTYHTRYEWYLHYLKPYAVLQKLRGGEIRSIQKIVVAHNRKFMNACDLVCAPTPFMRDCLSAVGTKTPIVVLPTGLSDENFDWDESTSPKIRQKYIGNKSFLFCSVSRLAKEKNISFLLHALARFKEMHTDCFRMLMIGDGPCRQALEREAVALGLGDNVIFTGSIPHAELSSYYRACDLFLFASKSETQGLVLLESMAAGLPVVAVKASGVCDVIINGENGWMTVEDKSVFAHAMEDTVFNRSCYSRLRMGASLTASCYTDLQMAANAEKAYEGVLKERIKASNKYRLYASDNIPAQI